MENTSVYWIVTLAVVVVSAPVSGLVVAGQEQANETEPPGVSDGTLESPSSLLQNHTRILVQDGFSANGTANITIVRKATLIDVERTANRTVTAGITEYRQSQRTFARATVACVTRNEEFWGNDSIEIRRLNEGGETTHNVSENKSKNALSAATILGPYLRSGNYTVTDTAIISENRSTGGTNTESLGGKRRVTLTATELKNATTIQKRLPDGASDARNFTATAVVDEDGRVHEFDASVDYTIQGSDQTHTITFDLQELGVSDVSRPAWVDEALPTDVSR